MTVSREKFTLRKKIYLFFFIAGLVYMFVPHIAHADLFGYEIQDVYQEISNEVVETNELLDKIYQVSKISPFTMLSSLSSKAGANNVTKASKTVGLAVATMLLMVDFFRKTVNFEWSSRWENVLLFLVKIIAVKQVIQNTDTIAAYIYALFDYINVQAVGSKPEFLPLGEACTVTVINVGDLISKIHTPFWFIKKALSPEESSSGMFTYTIYKDAVKMFYPTAEISTIQLDFGELKALTSPKNVYQATIERIFITPYFWFMKAIAYFIFVVVIGRAFELCVYTILAPLPLCTFASETTSDIGKNFIKNYVGVILQMAVITTMFGAYSCMMTYLTGTGGFFKGVKLVQVLMLLALAIGVGKSGEWSRRICGA